jgi:uncharacterized protein YecE (DUF72 family)
MSGDYDDNDSDEFEASGDYENVEPSQQTDGAPPAREEEEARETNEDLFTPGANTWDQWDKAPELTTDFFYLRLIGDRSIDEKDFGTIQKDRLEEMTNWARKAKSINDRVNFGIVAANNHYAGFGPATANGFRKMVGLKEGVWDEMKQGRFTL